MMMLTKKREETFRVTLSWKDHDKDHVYEAAVTLQSLLLNQQDFSVQKPKEYGNSGQVLARKRTLLLAVSSLLNPYCDAPSPLF